MGKPCQSQEFRQQQDLWYSKLRESGFEDLEDRSGWIEDYNSYKLLSRKNFNLVAYEITQEYYSWACEKLHTAKFKCQRDQTIWEYHAQGLTGAEISVHIGLERTWINRVIKKIKNYLK